MKSIAAPIAVFFLALPTFASSFEITERALSKKTVTIDISDNSLEEIKLVARRKITVSDCNQRFLEVKPTLLDGSGNGYYDELYLSESLSSTVMGCPTQKVSMVVESNPITFKTFKSPNSNDRVLKIFLIVDKNTEISIAK